ncbi:MAG TPA: hypothetical protein VF240_14570 [Pyrinomonadaceae bacterium]
MKRLVAGGKDVRALEERQNLCPRLRRGDGVGGASRRFTSGYLLDAAPRLK